MQLEVSHHPVLKITANDDVMIFSCCWNHNVAAEYVMGSIVTTLFQCL